MLKITKNTRFTAKPKKIKAKVNSNSVDDNDEVINQISFIK